MSEMRASFFPDLVRVRADGARYIECMVDGCRREAYDPHIHCTGHLTAAKIAQTAKLEALDRMTPEERRAARRRHNIETLAKQYALDAGQGDHWHRFMRKATETIDRKTSVAVAKAAASADDVY